jgi:Dolichyl-phosphate-mannose-protein mannosyltransferase/Tetratricopeptide repeat
MSGRSLPSNVVGSRPYVLTRGAYPAVVIALLAVITTELFFSTRQESQVVDESAHLFAGFEYWKHADFGRNPEHPPLVKLIAAVPLLPLRLKEPGIPSIPFFKAQDFIGGTEFLYGADADSILMRSRMVLALFTVGLALLVLAAAYEMFAPQTALFAIALFTLEPVLLANGALVTTDMALTCLFFASVYTFYRYVKRPSLTRLALCTIATGLTLVTKHSGALILPTLALIAASEVLVGRHEPASSGISSVRWGGRQALNFAVAFLAIALVSYVLLWAFYGFRYTARPVGLQMTPPLAEYSALVKSSSEKALISFFSRHHLFPEAYLYGWVDILQIPDTRPTFLFGKIYSTGQWFFFPAVFLIKSTITLLVLLTLVPFVGLWKHRRELLFLAIPPLFFLMISVSSKLNLGVRHILPIYPFCIVLAGAAAWRVAACSRRSAIVVAALFVFAAASSLNAFPNYLAYSNEAFGGPSKTYRVVTDSNADWGQGLKWVKSYLDKRHVSDCWFDYMNPFVNPGYYGIGCKPLVSALGRFGLTPASPLTSSISGTILIGATEVEGLFWGPDVLNPYEVFKRRRPDAIIGNIVLVYSGTFDVPLLAAHSHAGVALSLLGQHRVPEAITEAQRAVKQAPDSAEINAILGRILMAAGRTAEAQQAFDTALNIASRIHPDYQASLIRQILPSR